VEVPRVGNCGRHHQDYDRGVIIGEKSYGKGLVQHRRRFPTISQVKITIGQILIHDGSLHPGLDYSHRRDDGTVGSVPDSLKKEFKTTHGRTVLRLGGIDPDYKVEAMLPPPLPAHLFQRIYF